MTVETNEIERNLFLIDATLWHGVSDVKHKLFAVGLILLFIGVSLMFIAYPTKSDHETPAGELERAFSDELEQDYNKAVLLYWSGGIMILFGALITFLGWLVGSKWFEGNDIESFQAFLPFKLDRSSTTSGSTSFRQSCTPQSSFSPMSESNIESIDPASETSSEPPMEAPDSELSQSVDQPSLLTPLLSPLISSLTSPLTSSGSSNLIGSTTSCHSSSSAHLLTSQSPRFQQQDRSPPTAHSSFAPPGTRSGSLSNSESKSKLIPRRTKKLSTHTANKSSDQRSKGSRPTKSVRSVKTNSVKHSSKKRSPSKNMQSSSRNSGKFTKFENTDPFESGSDPTSTPSKRVTQNNDNNHNEPQVSLDKLKKPIMPPAMLAQPFVRGDSHFICEYCRRMVNKSWTRCPNCGARLEHIKWFVTSREIF